MLIPKKHTWGTKNVSFFDAAALGNVGLHNIDRTVSMSPFVASTCSVQTNMNNEWSEKYVNSMRIKNNFTRVSDSNNCPALGTSGDLLVFPKSAQEVYNFGRYICESSNYDLLYLFRSLW